MALLVFVLQIQKSKTNPLKTTVLSFSKNSCPPFPLWVQTEFLADWIVESWLGWEQGAPVLGCEKNTHVGLYRDPWGTLLTTCLRWVDRNVTVSEWPRGPKENSTLVFVAGAETSSAEIPLCFSLFILECCMGRIKTQEKGASLKDPTPLTRNWESQYSACLIP